MRVPCASLCPALTVLDRAYFSSSSGDIGVRGLNFLLVLAMVAGGIPTKRLRCKTSLRPQSGPRSKVLKVKSQRSRAIQEGLVPKARKAFALFLMEHSTLRKGQGGTKQQFLDDMKKMGQLWSDLDHEQKEAYQARSQQEFQAQHAAMMRLGLNVRQKLPQGPAPSKDVALPPQSRKFKVGPFTVMDQVDGRSPDGGSYGQVFPSRCGNGRACAIKVYRKRDGSDDATREVAMYHKLGQLTQSQQRWFPEMLNADVKGVPFPWVALSFEGASLHAWLSANGAFAPELVQPFALQLQAAIQTLHGQAGLLHLDIKPGNILWCAQLAQVKVCDFGLAEVFAQGVVEQPRYNEYVSLPYRPPELWHMTRDLRSLQSALNPSIDLWSFGCVLFEVCSGFMLMKPFDLRQRSSKQTISEWCAQWSTLTSAKSQKSSSHWHARLWHCSSWRSVVLAACHPEPKARKWMKQRGSS